MQGRWMSIMLINISTLSRIEGRGLGESGFAAFC